MSLLYVVIVLAVIGCLLGVFNKWIAPELVIDAKFVRLINVIVFVACLLWVIFDVFGLYSYIDDVRIGRKR